MTFAPLEKIKMAIQGFTLAAQTLDCLVRRGFTYHRIHVKEVVIRFDEGAEKSEFREGKIEARSLPAHQKDKMLI
jgi:hypothetical protein